MWLYLSASRNCWRRETQIINIAVYWSNCFNTFLLNKLIYHSIDPNYFNWLNINHVKTIIKHISPGTQVSVYLPLVQHVFLTLVCLESSHLEELHTTREWFSISIKIKIHLLPLISIVNVCSIISWVATWHVNSPASSYLKISNWTKIHI